MESDYRIHIITFLLRDVIDDKNADYEDSFKFVSKLSSDFEESSRFKNDDSSELDALHKYLDETDYNKIFNKITKEENIFKDEVKEDDSLSFFSRMFGAKNNS